MGAHKAFLVLDGATAEIIKCSYSFSRGVEGGKGQPTTAVSNGRIKIKLYSEAKEMVGNILTWMYESLSSKSGVIEIYSDYNQHDDDVDSTKVLLKKIAFDTAYVVDYQEDYEMENQYANTIESFEIVAEKIEVSGIDGRDISRFDMKWANS